ncbi:hypothetical protein IE53DRAFT_389397 [Violaceomyces palustris]|uniref:Uncharacterized protein n=1 Tax=Violaceomyces palustris TaxID=1673888 RepID=A0ACD0NRI4_9BASI|nr:hypothetical protein IE53DRAFT_389397 [Violaceomyces palustris]
MEMDISDQRDLVDTSLPEMDDDLQHRQTPHYRHQQNQGQLPPSHLGHGYSGAASHLADLSHSSEPPSFASTSYLEPNRISSTFLRSDDQSRSSSFPVPRLADPQLMSELPSTDPLSQLVQKHIPPHLRPQRNPRPSWSEDDTIQSSISTNSWRKLALLSKSNILQSSASSSSVGLVQVLEWWNLRLYSLCRLRLYKLMRTELVELWSVLESTDLPDHENGMEASKSEEAPFFPEEQADGDTTIGTVSTAFSAAGTGGGLGESIPASSSKGESGWRPTRTRDPARSHRARIKTLSQSPLVPFSLRVLKAREPKFRGDHRSAIESSTELIAYCKGWIRTWKRILRRVEEGGGAGEGVHAASSRSEVVRQMRIWKDRAIRVGIMVAAMLVEAKDYPSAIDLLEPLLSDTSVASSKDPYLLSSLARLYLNLGSLGLAGELFEKARRLGPTEMVSAEEIRELGLRNDALLHVFRGDFAKAEECLRECLQPTKAAGDGGETDFGTMNDTLGSTLNNLALSIFYQGQLEEPIRILESHLSESPSTASSNESFIFNLSTLHELRSEDSLSDKRRLLSVVAQWAGEGMGSSCLKLG